MVDNYDHRRAIIIAYRKLNIINQIKSNILKELV